MKSILTLLLTGLTAFSFAQDQQDLETQIAAAVQEALKAAKNGDTSGATTTTIKSFMIGPDGKMVELNQAGKDAAKGQKSSNVQVHTEAFTMSLDGNLVPLSPAKGESRHMIGVGVHPLAAHLTKVLKVPSGLMVERVFEGTPAEKAGLVKQDILLKVNGTDLSEMKQLTDEVNAAGKEGKSVDLTLLRGEGETVITLTPVKQEAPVMVSSIVAKSLKDLKISDDAFRSVQVFPLGQGGNAQTNQEAIKNLQKQVDELSKKLDGLVK